MTLPAYAVEHLSVVLQGKEILCEVSFSVETGSSLAIIGPNGCLLYTSPSPRDS